MPDHDWEEDILCAVVLGFAIFVFLIWIGIAYFAAN